MADASKRVAISLMAGTAVLLGLLVPARGRKPAPTTEPAATPDDGAPAAAPWLTFPRAGASRRVRPYGERDADTEDKAAAEARQVIARSRAAYAACTTYEDEGTKDTVFRGEDQSLRQFVFRTAFVGPNALRLAYRELPDEFQPEMFTQLIVNDGGVEAVDPLLREPRRFENLENAVATFGGEGLTEAILPLLPAGITHVHTWLDVPSPELAGTEVIDGETCDVVEATELGGTEHVRISIGRSDSLIHRVSEDEVQSAEEVRSMMARAYEVLRDAGFDVEVHSDPGDGGDSSFTITTFHPRCGRPVGLDALRLTDGSL
jgi:hypothetical protein